MEKQKKQFIALVIILVLCGGLFGGIMLMNNNKEKKSGAVDENLLMHSFLAENIVGINVSNKDGMVSISRTDSGAFKDDLGNIETFSKAKTDSYVASICEMYAEKVISGVEELEQYGFEDESLSFVTFAAKEGSVTYNLGGYNQVTGQYYVLNITDNSTVYVVSSDTYQLFCVNKSSFEVDN